MTPMQPQRLSIDAMITQAQQASPQQQVVDAPIVRIRDALLNLFEPVLDVFDKLHNRNVTVILPQGQRIVPEGDVHRRLLRSPGHALAVVQYIRPDAYITIRVATNPQRSYPDNILSARWRCIYTVNDQEIENTLIDNRDGLASWIIRQIVGVPTSPSPPVLTSVEEEPRSPHLYSNRELRVIDLDE